MPDGAGGVRSRTERLGQARLDHGNAGEADTGRAEVGPGDSVAPRSIERAEVQARLSSECAAGASTFVTDVAQSAPTNCACNHPPDIRT